MRTRVKASVWSRRYARQMAIVASLVSAAVPALDNRSWGKVLIDDEFDDDDLATNQFGVGSGWWAPFQDTEELGFLRFESDSYLLPKDRFMGPHYEFIDAVDSNVTLAGFDVVWPGSGVADRRDLGHGIPMIGTFSWGISSRLSAPESAAIEISRPSSSTDYTYGLRMVYSPGGCDRCGEGPPTDEIVWVATMPDWRGNSPIELSLSIDLNGTIHAGVQGTAVQTLSGSPHYSPRYRFIPYEGRLQAEGFGDYFPIALVDRVRVTTIPEPTSAALAVLGAPLLIVARRRLQCRGVGKKIAWQGTVVTRGNCPSRLRLRSPKRGT